MTDAIKMTFKIQLFCDYPPDVVRKMQICQIHLFECYEKNKEK